MFAEYAGLSVWYAVTTDQRRLYDCVPAVLPDSTILNLANVQSTGATLLRHRTGHPGRADNSSLFQPVAADLHLFRCAVHL